ncbi:hypothetical protein Q5X75_16650 [Acinetobacter baumannii]|uniref:hypothetical protein n=2 Tax=Acinetobacter baumannii TaxID=470 RepID=UPI000445774A|nr:hypothetical protein [Acinetobacter baumannii]EJB8539074.1 hypothetical protein [Acinetobacter baumannii]EKV4527331.1 hypothetical protein [Acinetobacter baumannii]EXB77234.1 hypothetical protein J542_3845 [Acinetobacter baumannii 299505]KQF22533.1 hypothetical protein APC04_11930 [Acinetobacter baumannii]MBJ9483030.1 hypothetical protein [Acinetobacter baumannii]
MKIEVNLNYLEKLYDYLYFMDDEEIMEFHINDKNDQTTLFNRMKELYESYGVNTRENILNALNYLLIDDNYLNYWRFVVPHDIPLEDVENKKEYINNMYINLFGALKDGLIVNEYLVNNKEVLSSKLKM